MTDHFAAFWAEWLQKTRRNNAKKAAERAWTAATKVTTPEAILLRLELRYRQEWALRTVQYRPHASTWLRAESWEEPVIDKTTTTELPGAPDPEEAAERFHALSGVHVHRCEVCETPHDWEHDDEFCCMTRDVICEEGLARMKERTK